MRYVILALFALTYVGISARRVSLLPIGRPAMAMVGASALFVAGAFAGPYGLTGDEALRAVEPHTIALLLGMMIVAAGLGEGGFFTRATEFLATRARSGAAMLWGVTVGSGLLSAALVNDAVCLLATPLVVSLARRTNRPVRPFLFAVAMGSNAGSALTLSGNPQNMLVARLSGLAYRTYLLRAALPTLAALAITAGILHWMHRREITAPATIEVAPQEAPDVDARAVDPWLVGLSLASLAGVIAANLAGAPLAWSALVGASVVLVASRERAESLLGRVDWSVLLFFAGLFVVVAALRKTALPDAWLAAVGPVRAGSGELALVGVLSVGSQVVSNVPLILLLEPWIRTFADPERAWTLTALVATLAGNLTLLGSVANIIVLERARERIGFVEYLRVGVPVTLLSTAAAVALSRL